MDTLYSLFKDRVEELKKSPTKNGNGKAKLIKSKTKTPEEYQKEIKDRISNLSKSSNGISVPKGLMPNAKWLKDFLLGEGLDCDWENRVIFKTSQ